MSNRIYNILFHTHTISGLAISVVLYVIFFAGSISFFRDDIVAWQRNEPYAPEQLMSQKFDRMLDTLSSRYGSLYGRNIAFRQYYQERNVAVTLEASQDSLADTQAKAYVYTYLDAADFETKTYFESYSLGEFIYRLHFFAQIKYPFGYWLAGFVALFFLFVVVTGIIVHWKKIITNFYVFRPGAKWKTIWTDAHTALGVIGLPFQLMYAVTGAALIIGMSVMLVPAVSFFYEGNATKMQQEILEEPVQEAFVNQKVSHLSIDGLVEQARAKWSVGTISWVRIQNYGDAGMRVIVDGRPLESERFLGQGRLIFDGVSGELLQEQGLMDSPGYTTGVDQIIRKLHFGDFGGYGLRVLYFLLGLITCFVILSGLLIWVEARDRKSVEEWKRKSNRWVSGIFISIALAMYPATAMAFLLVKLFPEPANPYSFTFQAYLYPWLVLTVIFSLLRSNERVTRFALLSGSVLGLLVPVDNGLMTGNWLCKTFRSDLIQIFVVDFFWLITSLLALWSLLLMKRSRITPGDIDEN